MSDTFELNQRIVYAGLVRVCSDRSVLKSAFEDWSKSNSQTPVDIFETVSLIERYLGLGGAERKALMLSMHSASSKLYDDLKPVPSFVLGDETPSQSGAAVADQTEDLKPAHITVTTRYLQVMSLNVQRSDASSHKELVKAVASEGLGGLKQEVVAWSVDNLNLIDLDASVTIEQCQDLAHEFYVLVCDFIGPVETDIIVNKAISEALTLSQAREFSPESLL